MHQDWKSFVRKRLSPGEYLGLHFTLGMLATIAALALFGSIAEDVVDREELAIFDLRVAAQIHAHATSAGIELFRAITQLGSVLMLAMIAGVTALAHFITRHRLLAGAWIATVARGALLDLGLKHLFERPRPEGATRYLHAVSWSFPSGHAMGALVGYGMLAYVLIMLSRSTGQRIAAVVIAAVLILAIGLSRLYLGVHYFTDVLGAYAAGAAWLSACVSGTDIARRRQMSQTAQSTSAGFEGAFHAEGHSGRQRPWR